MFIPNKNRLTGWTLFEASWPRAAELSLLFNPYCCLLPQVLSTSLLDNPRTASYPSWSPWRAQGSSSLIIKSKMRRSKQEHRRPSSPIIVQSSQSAFAARVQWLALRSPPTSGFCKFDYLWGILQCVFNTFVPCLRPISHCSSADKRWVEDDPESKQRRTVDNSNDTMVSFVIPFPSSCVEQNILALPCNDVLQVKWFMRSGPW